MTNIDKHHFAAWLVQSGGADWESERWEAARETEEEEESRSRRGTDIKSADPSWSSTDQPDCRSKHFVGCPVTDLRQLLDSFDTVVAPVHLLIFFCFHIPMTIYIPGVLVCFDAYEVTFLHSTNSGPGLTHRIES